MQTKTNRATRSYGCPVLNSNRSINSIMPAHKLPPNKFTGQDLTGQRFGLLIVLRFFERRLCPSGQTKSMWLCKCDCGKDRIVSRIHLTSGHAQSCGCSRKTHGQSKTRLHQVWLGIRHRCKSPKCAIYFRYGGRGITLDPAWEKFETFYADMSPTYKSGLSIERKDVNGPYSKENCIWANAVTQANNRRTNKLVIYQGNQLTIAQLARMVNMNRYLLTSRIAHGWEIEKAITTPNRRS